MKRPYDDDQLREAFQELRTETEARGRAPDFGVMMERARSDAAARRSIQPVAGDQRKEGVRPRPSPRLLWAGGWASAVIAAGVVGLLLRGTGADQDEEFERLVVGFASDPSGGAWGSPTARFLEVPGLEFIRSVPDVSGSVRGVDPGEPTESPTSDGREGRQ